MIKPLELHPKLHGVDHTARPTWKLRETVRFYRDILGLPLVHCISAKGWGREKESHADFLHFFFDSGNDSTIAFFYYIGTQQPPELVVPKGYMAMANHTAWRVESEAELLDWQRRLESHDQLDVFGLGRRAHDVKRFFEDRVEVERLRFDAQLAAQNARRVE